MCEILGQTRLSIGAVVETAPDHCCMIAPLEKVDSVVTK
jgi:hypothetical protein